MGVRRGPDALVGATLSLGDAALRAAYVASVVRAWEVPALAQALDAVCERAEQAEVAAREALLSIVDALNAEGMDDVVQRLREEAEGRSLLALERLIADPHPDVIHRLLRNPRVLEDDVVRLAARRPGRSEVLVEIARSTQWVHRPRVRMALVLNPATPAEIAARIAGLLLRPELEFVAGSPHVPAAVRALCMEHLERRPPVERPGDEGVH